MRTTLAAVAAALLLYAPAAAQEPLVRTDLLPAVADTPGPRWRTDFEYLMWWQRRGYAPPILTTGPVASQGVLGEPGTKVVYGDERLRTRHNDRFFGVRFSAEYAPDDMPFSLEVRGQFMERDSTYRTIKYRNDVLLALSYIDARTGRETSQVITGTSLDRGELLGGFVGYSRNEFFTQDANVFVPMSDGENGWKIDALAGLRFAQMRDRYHHTATNVTLPDQAVLTGVVDYLNAYNAFYGAQVGVRAECDIGRWFVQYRGSAALGVNAEMLRAKGERVYHDPQVRTVTPGGLFIQPSNAGEFRRGHIDALFDTHVNLGYRVTDNVRLWAGYGCIYWADPIRAAQQIDRVTDVNQTSAADAVTARAWKFRGDPFFAHGLHGGIELRW